MKIPQHRSPSFLFKNINLILLACLLIVLTSIEGAAQTPSQAHDEYIQFFNGQKIEHCADVNQYRRFRYLYNSLDIYQDEKGEMSFEEISKNQHLFQENNTRENFDPDQTYWVKVDIQARRDKQDSIMFFFQHFENFQGWEYVDAYLVHEDGKMEHQQTGFSLPKHKKSIDYPFYPVAFGLVPNERASLILRLENFKQEKETVYSIKWRSDLVQYIQIKVWIKNFSDLLSPYQFDGNYIQKSFSRPFRGNQIFQFDLYQDTSHQLDISTIHRNRETIQWGYSDSITPVLGEVYWMKTQFVGTELFNGEHLFHVSSWIGQDALAFENVDIYIPDDNGGFSHQRTGHGVPLKERPYDFWATFFKVDLQPNDTVDVYIRLEGVDPYFTMGTMFLYHIDPSSVFPVQNRIATKRSLFLGAMGIQFLLFIGLFFIQRERIHFYFTLVILGQFLSFVFTSESYASYVLFPSWRQYELPLFYLGSFLTSFGMLQFTATYFNYSPSSVFRKWVFPIFLIPFGLMCLYGFLPPHDFFYTQKIMLFSLLMVPIFFTMAFLAKGQAKYLKSLFIIAFIPVTLVFIRIVGFNWTIFPQYGHLMNFEKVTLVLDWVSLGMVFTLWLLGFSIGFRNRLLKKEKEQIEQQNSESKKIIFQKEIETAQLQKMDELKTKLFTNITHEFRTPLTVIMGINDELVNQAYIQKLSQTQKTKVEQNHKLISRNSKNLLNLISQLLDLSKADSGALELQEIQDNIIPYLNYLTESFYSRANGKNIRLVFYSESDELMMDFDEAKIQHIIYNLISNALKFTHEDGKVILHAKQETKEGQKFLKIIMSDNGIGISEKRLPHIFDRFYQVDNSSTRREEGTGIGLALVKELVELMQGQIEVTSTEGKGTTFTIDLPITNQAPIVNLNGKENSSINILPSEESDVLVEEELVLIESDELPLLLIVEDNTDVTQYICQILEKDYQIVTAKNGEIGMEKAFQLIPDLIISDVMMPKVDGNTLTTTLKNDNRTNHIPIIMLTAKTDPSDKIEGIKSGADAFLSKPFNKTELIIRIDQLLTLRKTLQERYAKNNLTEAAIDEELLQQPIISKENFFLTQLEKIVTENIENSDLNVEFLAKTFKLSTSQLYRKIKALTDVSPNVFIRNLRLKKGLVLLKTTDLNVSEVAYAVGFNDLSYFSKSFRKLYGKSPMFYRK